MPIGHLLTRGLGAFNAPNGSSGTSIGADIEAAILARVQTGSYLGISNPSAIVARALPKVSESLAPAPPCILLAAADEDEPTEPATTEDTFFVTYPFEIAIISAFNRDATTKTAVRRWRQIARKTLGEAGRTAIIAAVPAVYMIDPPKNGSLFSRSRLSDQFVYCSFVVRVYTHEDSTTN